MKILANDGIDATGLKMLQQAGIEVDTQKVEQDNLVTELKNYDGITVRSATKVTQAILEANTHLKVIGRGGVGLDNIDLATAAQLKIPVVYTPKASSRSVAELVMASVFVLSRNLHHSYAKMPNEGISTFNQLKKELSNSSEVIGKTLGIIGMGNIGIEIAKMAIGNGMNVIYHSLFPENITFNLSFNKALNLPEVEVKLSTQPKSKLCAEADFITMHVPYKSGETPIITEAEIALMKPNVGIINTSRGGAIQEQTLLNALDAKQIKYAALDVFEKEPTQNQQLLQHQSIAATPHIGGTTNQAQERVGIELAQQIIDILKK